MKIGPNLTLRHLHVNQYSNLKKDAHEKIKNKTFDFFIKCIYTANILSLGDVIYSINDKLKINVYGNR